MDKTKADDSISPAQKKNGRLVVSISTNPVFLDVLDRVIADAQPHAPHHIDRSRITASLWQLVVEAATFIRPENITDKNALTDELLKAIKEMARQKQTVPSIEETVAEELSRREAEALRSKTGSRKSR